MEARALQQPAANAVFCEWHSCLESSARLTRRHGWTSIRIGSIRCPHIHRLPPGAPAGDANPGSQYTGSSVTNRISGWTYDNAGTFSRSVAWRGALLTMRRTAKSQLASIARMASRTHLSIRWRGTASEESFRRRHHGITSMTRSAIWMRNIPRKLPRAPAARRRAIL